MIKDTRYIIKRVIIGVLICLILSFIRTCEVKALNAVQSFELNYHTSNPSVLDLRIYQDTSYNTLKNYGRGYIQFTIAFYSWNNSSAHYNGALRAVRAYSGNNLFACNIGTATNNYEAMDDYDLNVYSVICPVNLGSYGLSEITIEQVNTGSFSINTSIVATFISDLDADNGAKLDTINSTLATYLQSVYNATYQTQVNTGATNNYLSAIQTLLNTDLTAILQALNSSTNQIVTAQEHTTTAVEDNTQAVNDVNDSINNSNVSIDTLPSDNLNLGPISALVTLPITALNNIVNAFSGTCTPFNIGSLFGTNLVFPCINIESFIGSFLWNTIDIIITGIYIFGIRQKFVDLFYKLVTLKDIGLKGGF